MRASGVVDSPRDLTPGDHLCWVYDHPSEFDRAAVAFLAEGLERGERVSFLTERDEPDARSAIEPLGDIDGLIARGMLTIGRIGDAYRPVRGGPEAQADAYAGAAEAALCAGFAGLRVAADATPMVIEANQRRAFALYEHVIDRRMTSFPFTAMCAYDRSLLGDAAAELACLHPATNLATVGFNLTARPDGSLVLTGEVDAMATDLFAAALEHVTCQAGEHLRIDATGLAFIDHRGLLTLDAIRGIDRIELVTTFGGAGVLADLLDLRRVDVAVVE